jgi:hypothetical protein
MPVSYVRRPSCACAPASAVPGRYGCHGAAALSSVRPCGGQRRARAMRRRREHAHGALRTTARRATGVPRDTSGVCPPGVPAACVAHTPCVGGMQGGSPSDVQPMTQGARIAHGTAQHVLHALERLVTAALGKLPPLGPLRRAAATGGEPWRGDARPSEPIPPQYGGPSRPTTRSTPGHRAGPVRARTT